MLYSVLTHELPKRCASSIVTFPPNSSFPFFSGAWTILMMLVGNTLYATLEDALRIGWPVAFVIRLLIFNIPVALMFCLPVAAALGSALAIGRLGRDNELTTLRSVGVPLRRSLAPVFLAGIVLSVAGGYIAEEGRSVGMARAAKHRKHARCAPRQPGRVQPDASARKTTS